VESAGLGFVEVAVVTEEHVSGRRWPLMGWRPRQLKEVVGSVLQRLPAADGGSPTGLVCRGGTRERCGVVGALALGTEECGNKGAEERSESRAECASFGGFCKKRRDGFSHGPTA
jgi:hypothetical protein